LPVPTIQDHAVCLRQWDFSETSQTVSLLTREFGLIRCIAKGSKREKSPFSGGLEIATMGHMVAIVKPTTELAILTAWDLSEPMYLIRRSLERYHACMFAIDLIPRLINDHDPHPSIYDALEMTLQGIADPALCTSIKEIHSQLAWYLWQLIEHTGARPELMADVYSGEELDEDAPVFGFSSSLGGLTVDPKDHPSPRVNHELSDAWRVRRSTVDLLRQLRAGASPSEINTSSQEQLERLGGLLISYVRAIIGTEVPSSSWIYPNAHPAAKQD